LRTRRLLGITEAIKSGYPRIIHIHENAYQYQRFQAMITLVLTRNTKVLTIGTDILKMPSSTKDYGL